MNLAGHVTNFVDNEASLDFLSNAMAPHEPLCGNNNFSALMRDLDNESGIPPRKEAFDGPIDIVLTNKGSVFQKETNFTQPRNSADEDFPKFQRKPHIYQEPRNL